MSTAAPAVSCIHDDTVIDSTDSARSGAGEEVAAVANSVAVTPESSAFASLRALCRSYESWLLSRAPNNPLGASVSAEHVVLDHVAL